MVNHYLMKINIENLKKFSRSNYSKHIKDFVFIAISETLCRKERSDRNMIANLAAADYNQILNSIKIFDIIEDLTYNGEDSIIINFDEINDYDENTQLHLINLVKQNTLFKSNYGSFKLQTSYTDLVNLNLIVSEVELLKMKRERKLRQIEIDKHNSKGVKRWEI